MVIVFAFNGSDDSFAGFAASVQGSLEGNLIHINTPQLWGEVRRADLDQGLSVIHWTLQTRETVTFRNLHTPVEQHSFIFTYYFEPDQAVITFNSGGRQSFVNNLPGLLVFSRPTEVDITYAPGTSVRSVSLVFTESWLLQQTSGLRDQHPIGDYMVKSIENTAYRPLSKGELFFSKELYHEFSGSANSLLIRAHVYNLLAVLYRQLSVQARHVERRRDNPIIWQVEKELLQHIHNTPPGIEELARKFFMSPSTLQRHFKSVFGMNAYEYYLRKKMDEAKKLLRAGQSVNTVSYALGYESVSHFIRIFRKIVGENPGRFKKTDGQMSS